MDTDFDPRKLTVEQLLQVRDLLIELRMLRKGDTAVRPAVRTPRKPKEWWAALDWTKSTTALAREHGLNIGTVRIWRIKLGQPEVKDDRVHRPTLTLPQRPRVKPETYAHLDWANKPDAELAREVGLTRERIRQIRARLGHPRAHAWALKFERFKKKFEGRTELTFEDARKEFPMCNTTFLDYCARCGIKTPVRGTGPPTRYPWHLYDWRLPSKILGGIWKHNPGSIANHRSAYGKPRPSFGRRIPPKFLPLIGKQKQAAAEWKASQKKPGTDSTAAPG